MPAMTQSERALRHLLRSPLSEWNKRTDKLPAAYEDIQGLLAKVEYTAQIMILLAAYVGARVGADGAPRKAHWDAAKVANKRLTRVRRAMDYYDYDRGPKV